MTTLRDLRVKIFADGADLSTIAEASANPLVKGFLASCSRIRGSN